jgi:hypothetical protein
MATADSMDKVAKSKRMAAESRAMWEKGFGKKGYLKKDLKTLGMKAPSKPADRPGLKYGK